MLINNGVKERANQAVGATGGTSADCLVLMIPENPRQREKVALAILALLLDLAAEKKQQARDRKSLSICIRGITNYHNHLNSNPHPHNGKIFAGAAVDGESRANDGSPDRGGDV
jgi:hypothetical protein